METTTFGALFYQKRQATGLTLRKFCERHHLDPANVSRWERNLLPPPLAETSLRRLAVALGIEEDSDEWQLFFDLAAATQGVLPTDLRGRTDLVAKMPLVFRTLRGEAVTEEKLHDLYQAIKDA